MEVDVLDPATGREIFTCTGPDPFGQCGREPTAEVVPCAGATLQTRSGPGLVDSYRFEVSRSVPACPLRYLALRLI